jgi:hypothetical protein
MDSLLVLREKVRTLADVVACSSLTPTDRVRPQICEAFARDGVWEHSAAWRNALMAVQGIADALTEYGDALSRKHVDRRASLALRSASDLYHARMAKALFALQDQGSEDSTWVIEQAAQNVNRVLATAFFLETTGLLSVGTVV